MAVVQVNENTLDFIFDSNTNFYNDTEVYNLLTLNENTEICYYNENDTLVNINYNYPNTNDVLDFLSSSFPVWEGVYTNTLGTRDIQFAKYNTDINDEVINVQKNQWYAVDKEKGFVKIKGIRIINFEYYENQNVNTINTLVNPYIGTKTSFAKTYTLRVNGKLLNTINGKKIRNLIYNGTTYEIAEPVASGYNVQLQIMSILMVEDLAYSINNGDFTNVVRNEDGNINYIDLKNVETITFKVLAASTYAPGGFVPAPGDENAFRITEIVDDVVVNTYKIDPASEEEIVIDITKDTTFEISFGAI